MLTGTIVNALAVLAGSVAGLLLTQLAQRFSRFLPAGSTSMGERLQTIIMQGVALCVIFIGISGSFKGSNTLIAILSMVIGAIIGSLLLFVLTSNVCGLEGTGANTCQNGVSPVGGLIAEIVFTFVFVLVVLGTTDAKKGAGNFAGLAIGLALILVHLVCIRYTGTSVNPARSIGPALFQGGEALSQLWIFIVGPFVGGALAALVWKVIGCDCECCKK